VGQNAGASITTGIRNTTVGAASLDAEIAGNYSTAMGYGALSVQSNAGGTDVYNTAVGYLAGAAVTTGVNNTLIGGLAGDAITTASNNTAVGYSALTTNTTGDGQAFGAYALFSNTTGSNNTALGGTALYANTTGVNNLAAGLSSLRYNTTGGYNVALGANALNENTTASNNTAVGYQAGYSNTTGTGSVYNGYQSGYNVTVGSYNTFTGDASGYNTTGGSNTFIGQGAGFYVTTGTKNTILGKYDGNQGGLDIRTASNNIVLSDGDGNPRGIFDSSGNFLVGKTAFDTSTAGFEARSTGFIGVTRADVGAYFTRLTTDGEIIQFRKDGTTVGSIGCNVGSFAIGQSNTALGFFNTDRILFPATASGVVQDNAIDLGYSNGRFDDIYATNGTIQTSDRNDKQDIEVLSDAEQRVAVACKGLLRKFRWKSSVEEKGDDARIHFGIIAQDLQAAFEAEGLDAGRYAMFISSTWTDEETGEERSRMGVRYSELLAFIIAAI
jgi:hypothetical protein